MSDVKVEQKISLSRAEAATWIADLAAALAGDGPAEIRLAHGTVQLTVPDRIHCEAEVEVDGDEVELEFELKWSTSRRPSRPASDGASGD